MTPDAYDSAPPRGTPLTWTRLYRKGGRYAHLHCQALSPFIACDNPVAPGMPAAHEEAWLGTGGQDEYEHATALPLCRRCFARRETAYG